MASPQEASAATPGATEPAASPPLSAARPGPMAPAVAGPSGPTLGVLSGIALGTEITRGSTRFTPQQLEPLLAGDRLTVPASGTATVDLYGQGQNKTPVYGIFSGGTDAVITTVATSPGVKSAAGRTQQR